MSRVLGKFDATAATRASNVYTLPTLGALQMAITCATTGRTAQTAAATLATALGANAARAQSFDGATFGLMVESSRKNWVAGSVNDLTNGSWSDYEPGGNHVTASAPPQADDPAGSTGSSLITFTSAVAGDARYNSCAGANNNGPFTQSFWARSTGSSGNIEHENLANGHTSSQAITTAWARYDHYWGADTNVNLGLAYNSGPTGVLVYGSQAETGKYPTSVVTTAAATRAADVLKVTAPAIVVPGGFFDVALVYRPMYTQAETAADHTLFYLDANNNLIFQQSTAKFVLTINSVAVTSSAATFSRLQSITLRARHTPLGTYLNVSGATTGNGTATGAGQPAVSVPATAYLLGGSAGAEEASDLLTVTFRHPVAP